MISALTFGQKKEIRSAEKAIKSGNFSEAISVLEQADGLIANADKTIKSQYYLAKGDAYLGDAGDSVDKLKIAADSFLKAKEVDPNGKYTAELENRMNDLRTAIVNSAMKDQESKNYVSASEKLYTGYRINKIDTSFLYYAANNALNGKNVETALDYYKMLLDVGYTGIVKEYYATNKETNLVKKFDTKDGRDIGLKNGPYINPIDKNSDSKTAEILKNMTFLYNSKGETDKVAELITQARKENPNDIELMKTEAFIYYKSGDMEKFKAIINEVIDRDPDNPELYFNLGVASNKNGEMEAAMGYYTKALELNPDYAEALINKAQLILDKDNGMIEEMNALGTSTADYNRYDELQEDRINMFKEALPYLEKASNLRKDNIQLMRTLKNIYSQLGMDDKAKEMRTRLEELEVEGN